MKPTRQKRAAVAAALLAIMRSRGGRRPVKKITYNVLQCMLQQRQQIIKNQAPEQLETPTKTAPAPTLPDVTNTYPNRCLNGKESTSHELCSYPASEQPDTSTQLTLSSQDITYTYPICRGCLKEKESVRHILCSCPAFATVRMSILGKYEIDMHDVGNLPVDKLLELTKAVSWLDSVE